MLDLESLVGVAVTHVYLTRELRALGLTDRQIGKAQRDRGAPQGVQLEPRGPHLYVREEVDAYVAEKRALLGFPPKDAEQKT